MHFRSAPKAELGAIWTPFPPSVFQGTGQEPRKSIVFSIPDEVRRQIELIEEHLREKLRPYAPQIDAIWHSSVKPPGQHPGSLRAKITLEGPGACLFIDDENKVVDIPEDWAGLTLIPVVEFRACYLQKGAAGMILEVVKVMTGQKREEMETDTAFL